MRCMGRCNHAPGTCTADPDYQRLIDLTKADRPGRAVMRMSLVDRLRATKYVDYYGDSHAKAADTIEELASVLRELVYGGGGHVWTRARELLAKIESGNE
jgi:hypothetical protein